MPVESLAVLDIGGGTQDILLWRAEHSLENAVKMVLPSPTRVVAARLAKARARGAAVYLHGELMGGGAVTRAVRDHLAAGLKVYATPSAAATLFDDPERVRAMGVEITETPPVEARGIFTTDLDLLALRQACALFEVELPSRLAVAVCDHGYSPGYSNRKFRFNQWRSFLEGGGELADLLIEKPPAHLTRLAALARQAPGVLLMDTAAAAIWGALEDPAVAAAADGPGVCVVNAGNMHTVAFLIRGRRVLGVYEHHTVCLDSAALGDQVARFIAGRLGEDEVFEGEGHGVCRLPEAPTSLPGPVVLTGPRRRLAEGLGWRVANPHGDVMLAGCFGLAAAARLRLGL